MRAIVSILLLALPALLHSAVCARAQTADVAAPSIDSPSAEALTVPADTTELWIHGIDAEVEGAWLEVTSLRDTPGGDEVPPQTVTFSDQAAISGPRLIVPEVPQGPALVCVGADEQAASCRPVFIDRGESVSIGPALVVDLFIAEGVPVIGAYRLLEQPLAGARVAVVPAGLRTRRPFTMPLQLVGGELVREVTTDDEGQFALPPLAGGAYFLETWLASGRMVRSEVFEVPAASAVRATTGTDDADAMPPLDLGVFELDAGLSLEILVLDNFDQPIRNALVAGRQGDTAAELDTFSARTDADGKAVLSGFDVERPVDLTCRAPGHLDARSRHELVPVVHECVLEALASVGGTIIDSAGQAPGAKVVAHRTDLEEGGRSAGTGSTDAVGRFRLVDLPAGQYRLSIGAAGWRSSSLEVELAPGQQLDIGTLVLSAASTFDGVVVDRDTGEPVAGAEIRIIDPPDAGVAVSDEDGNFSLDAAAESVRVEAVADGYARHRRLIDTEAAASVGSEQALRLEMRRGGWIRVLIGSSQAPCAGCRVTLSPGGQELVTDGGGEALSTALVPGYFEVVRSRVTHLGSTSIEQPEAERRWVKVRQGRIATVRFDSGSERPVQVRLTPQPESSAGAIGLSARSPVRTERLQALGDGSFEVALRPREDLELFLHWWDAEAAAEMQVHQGVLPSTWSEPVFVLELGSSIVHGRIASDGEPVAGLAVRLRGFVEGRLAAETRTAADGTFRFLHVPSGAFSVQAGARTVQMISLAPRQTVDIGRFDLFGGSF